MWTTKSTIFEVLQKRTKIYNYQFILLKMRVVSDDLKLLSESASLNWSGKEFQSLGAATEKDRSP